MKSTNWILKSNMTMRGEKRRRSNTSNKSKSNKSNKGNANNKSNRRISYPKRILAPALLANQEAPSGSWPPPNLLGGGSLSSATGSTQHCSFS
mmetsp:Transcript_4131/g.8638  ORF Transcript_4131/g.8638 Transcript_4131/m.8638 type:complete len:93 (-) Transcript_4131:78-356(-)